MSNTVKLLSFDLDDTLWPCSPVIQHAEEVLYQWLSEHVPVIARHYDLDQLQSKRKLLLKNQPELAPDLTRLRIRSLQQLAGEFNLAQDWIEPAFEVFYEARQRITLYDDVKPVLDELGRYYRLVSLTNGNASPVKTGVDYWFDFSLNSAMIGKLKSEPDIYRQVQQQTAVKPGEMVHIGDHPVQDIYGAQSAGVFAVWINREGKPWSELDFRPDAVINSLLELPGLLKDLSNTDTPAL